MPGLHRLCCCGGCDCSSASLYVDGVTAEAVASSIGVGTTLTVTSGKLSGRFCLPRTGAWTWFNGNVATAVDNQGRTYTFKMRVDDDLPTSRPEDWRDLRWRYYWSRNDATSGNVTERDDHAEHMCDEHGIDTIWFEFGVGHNYDTGSYWAMARWRMTTCGDPGQCLACGGMDPQTLVVTFANVPPPTAGGEPGTLVSGVVNGAHILRQISPGSCKWITDGEAPAVYEWDTDPVPTRHSYGPVALYIERIDATTIQARVLLYGQRYYPYMTIVNLFVGSATFTGTAGALPLCCGGPYPVVNDLYDSGGTATIACTEPSPRPCPRCSGPTPEELTITFSDVVGICTKFTFDGYPYCYYKWIILQGSSLSLSLSQEAACQWFRRTNDNYTVHRTLYIYHTPGGPTQQQRCLNNDTPDPHPLGDLYEDKYTGRLHCLASLTEDRQLVVRLWHESPKPGYEPIREVTLFQGSVALPGPCDGMAVNMSNTAVGWTGSAYVAAGRGTPLLSGPPAVPLAMVAAPAGLPAVVGVATAAARPLPTITGLRMGVCQAPGGPGLCGRSCFLEWLGRAGSACPLGLWSDKHNWYDVDAVERLRICSTCEQCSMGTPGREG